jgi:hypothetical protein
MICPHCKADIKYRERNYNTCSNCNKEFAFEPKTHPLNITDKYFSNVVEKLSNNGKLFYTLEQLQFAVSRKKMKSGLGIVGYFILAIITTVISLTTCLALLPKKPEKSIATEFDIAIGLFLLLIPVVIFFSWIIFIFRKIRHNTTHFLLPQTQFEFKDTVIYRWKGVYGNFPKNLIIEKPQSVSHNYNLRGILFCENQDTADFFIANQLNIRFGLAIFTDLHSQIQANLPIYVLHDASSEGYTFLEKVKQTFGNQKQIIDMGFRPNSVMNSNLIKFRQPNNTNNNFSGLNPAEIQWLKDGYYAPLFVLRPVKLIQYLGKKFGRTAKQIAVETPEKQAQAIGFMTWVGEK